MTSAQLAETYVLPSLTTIFTPPSSCLANTFTLSPDGSDVVNLSIARLSQGNSIYTNTNVGVLRGYAQNCFPPNFALLGKTTIVSNTVTNYFSIYSPGYCPVGYSTATAVISDAITTATCCPSGFEVDASDNICQRLESSVIATVLNGSVTSILTGNPYAGTPTDQYTYLQFTASLIVVKQQSSDLSLFTRSAPTSSFASPASTAAIATPAATNSAGSEPTIPPNHSLSTGAQAGIGVGVSIGAILLLLGIFLFWRRRRKLRQDAQKPGHSDIYGKPELDGEGKKYPELPEQDIREVDGVAKPPELSTGGAVAELEGNWQGHEMSARDGERL